VKIANGAITATAKLGIEAAEALATLDAEGKVEFPCEVELTDKDGNRVATATVPTHHVSMTRQPSVSLSSDPIGRSVVTVR